VAGRLWPLPHDGGDDGGGDFSIPAGIRAADSPAERRPWQAAILFTLLEAAEELVRRCFSTSAVAPSRSAFERE
jgi:hypothetical protein